MTRQGSSAGDREDPPFLFGLIGEGIKRSSSLFNATLRSIDQRLLVKIWWGGTLAVLLLVVTAGSAASPGVVGVLQALFVGVFTALLFAVGFGVLVTSTRRSPVTADVAVSSATVPLNSQLAPTIAELDALRREAIEQVKARSITRVPLGIVAAVLLWVLCQSNSNPPGAFGFIMFVIVGALGGEMWAVHAPDRRYRRIYKQRVLPQLAGGGGNGGP